ncbi:MULTISPECIES: type IV pilus modification protein PilV [unclassified Variovorax]|jgi:type IV pilus assembly protein PilV|uniref:type IV pilus modification protein PilV n=1 Tax=unclassified Variovorax TaxID=663243 RepID=UPI000F7F9746|nr:MULTISPECIES: type IV pilus modification protein PilV [unclassified Variovorax]RSZ34471.1 type IV pilus modification protein PilV [Variovorax sp. 553]RSZ34967.1 type IV pilus modification protein PilV [Variovorax sp. 679]
MKRRLPFSASSGSQRQSGFALLEVLVSILIFSFGVLGLVGLQARAISLSTDAEDRNRAALLANDIASAMWLGKSVTVDTSAGSAWQKRVADPANGGLPNGGVTVTSVASNSADITITWRAPARADTDGSTFSTRVTLP